MSDTKKPQDQDTTTDKLVDAYQRLLDKAHEAFDSTAKDSAPAWKEMVDKTRENMVELGELSREEAEKVSKYLQRDIEDAAQFMNETGETIRGWWQFDLKLMEQRLMETFARAADQTSVQLSGLAEQARRASLYQAGEITGPGTLVCDNCGAEIHFVKPGRIPACADCGGLVFKRANPSEAAPDKDE